MTASSYAIAKTKPACCRRSGTARKKPSSVFNQLSKVRRARSIGRSQLKSTKVRDLVEANRPPSNIRRFTLRRARPVYPPPSPESSQPPPLPTKARLLPMRNSSVDCRLRTPPVIKSRAEQSAVMQTTVFPLWHVSEHITRINKRLKCVNKNCEERQR